jgi:hypothetical protein
VLRAAPYVLGMLLSGEFESPGVSFDKSQIPIDLDEAKWRVERAAYLNCGPAQYKMVSHDDPLRSLLKVFLEILPRKDCSCISTC